MIAQVCYADDVYVHAQKWNIKFAQWFGGCDEVYAYNRDMLPEEFKKQHERILSFKRGGGYWIWKSYIIADALKKLEYGDYLFYCDSGGLLKRNLKHFIKVMERDKQDMMFFEVCGHADRVWTKRDVFIALDCDTEEYYNTTQIMSGFIMIKKTDHSVAFIDEYVRYSQTGNLITDEPNELGQPNYEGFKENRHDQSVLSLLSKKWGYKPYRDPSQWGDYQKVIYKKKAFRYPGEYDTYERSTFPTMIILHRYKVLNIHNILAHYYHHYLNHRKYKKNPYAGQDK